MPLDTTTLGTAVEIGQITKELKKLWAADQTRTRASLINLAIVCEGPEAMNENTALLDQIIQDHSCRALLVGVDPKAAETKTQAWVNAHCYLPKAGAKHVCSEQISFYLQGNIRTLLPNLLLSHLESDLPLTLWWQCECPELVDPELWRWVDRLIYDSRKWSDPAKQFSLLKKFAGNGRVVFCDLNWTRTLRLRQGLAQMFDQADQLPIVRGLTHVAITHAPGSRTTALLLLSWLAAQLGWKVKVKSAAKITFTAGAQEVTGEFIEAAGPAVSEVKLTSPAGTVTVDRPKGTNYLHVEVAIAGQPIQHLMPADSENLMTVLDQEMSAGGRRRVYGKALEIAEPLL